MNQPLLFVAAEAKFFVSHRLPLAEAARDRGHRVAVATPDGPEVERIREAGLPWHRIAVRRRTTLASELRAVPSLLVLYRRLRPGIVHHVAIKPVLYGTIAARLAGVPAVVNAVTGLGYALDEQRAASWLGRALRLALAVGLRHGRARFVFQNREDAAFFVDRGWCNADSVRLIPGAGVDTRQFQPAAEEPGGRPLVLLAARLLRSKGIEEFVAAARQLRDAACGARFAIAGELDADNPQSFDAAATAAWRDSGVEVLGRCDDMAALLRRTTLFVLPSWYREGVPKALVEAAAAGVPMVTTDMPGCRDVVQHGANGLLVPPRDAQALALAIGSLLGDAETRRRMGAVARRKAVDELSLEHVLRQTLMVYDELLTGPPAVRRARFVRQPPVV